MKLTTKVLLLVSVPVLYAWIQLLTMSFIFSLYEKAFVSAAIPLEHFSLDELSRVKLLIVLSSIANQLLSIALALYFARMLTRRIAEACSDLRKIQQGVELEPRKDGTYEFALLDSEIRKIAQVFVNGTSSHS